MKKTVHNNVRMMITLEKSYVDWGEGEELRHHHTLEKNIQEAKKLLLPGAGLVKLYTTVLFDKEYVCGHCGDTWEVEDGKPICCDAAIKEWEASK